MVPTESSVPKVLKILLAEDNSVNQAVICEMLASIGCHVKVVPDGQQAVDALTGESYDMVFMDCQMPVMDGHEAARRIREFERQKGTGSIPIIGITGRVVRDNIEKSEKAFMDGLLDKPFSIEQLKYTIFLWTGVQLQDSTQEQGQEKVLNHCSPSVLSPSDNTDSLNTAVLKNISNLENGSNEFLKKIVTIYFRDAPHHISEIRKGVQEKNPDKILRAAHSLKSSSANLGAMSLSGMCQELESNARMQMIDDAGSRLAGIESEYDVVVKALNCFMNNLD